MNTFQIILDVDETLGFFYPALELFKHLRKYHNKFSSRLKKIIINNFIKESNSTRPFLKEFFNFIKKSKFQEVIIFSKNHDSEWIEFLCDCFETEFNIKFDKIFTRRHLINNQKHSGNFNYSTIVIDDNTSDINYSDDDKYIKINVEKYNPEKLAINYKKLADDLLKYFPKLFSEYSSKYYINLLVNPKKFRVNNITEDDNLLKVINRLKELLNIKTETKIDKRNAILKDDLEKYQLVFNKNLDTIVNYKIHLPLSEKYFDENELNKISKFDTNQTFDLFLNDRYSYTVIVAQLMYLAMIIPSSNNNKQNIDTYMKEFNKNNYKIINFNYDFFDKFKSFLDNLLISRFKIMGFDYSLELIRDIHDKELLFNSNYDCNGQCKSIGLWNLENYSNKKFQNVADYIISIIQELLDKYNKIKDTLKNKNKIEENKIRNEIDNLINLLKNENEIKSWEGNTLKGWRWIYSALELAKKLNIKPDAVIRKIKINKIKFAHIYIKHKGDNYLPIDNAKLLIKNPKFFNKLMNKEYIVPQLRIFKLKDKDEYVTYDHRRLLAYKLSGIKEIEAIVDNYMWDLRENLYGPERCVYSKNDKSLLVLFPDKNIKINKKEINQRKMYGNYAILVGEKEDFVNVNKLDFNIDNLHWPCKNLLEINSKSNIVITNKFNKIFKKEINKYLSENNYSIKI